MKNISQKRFLRGLNSAFGYLAQPDGTLPRLVNLLLNKRGALKTCDGSKIIAQTTTAQNLALGICEMFSELFLYMPAGGSRAYFGLIKSPLSHMGAPVQNVVTHPGGGGGTLPAAVYFYLVTANDGAGGETLVSNEQSGVCLGAGDKLQVNWNLIPLAISYNIYRSTIAGTETLLTTNVTGSFFIDDGTLFITTVPQPIVDTTQETLFIKIPTAGNSAPAFATFATNFFNFPADMLPNVDGTGGGTGGGGGGPQGSGGAGSTSVGGVIGNVSSIPVILQFVNKMILCLGNGITPYQSDGTNPGTLQITNTFTALYPIWQTAVNYLVGDLIQVTIGPTTYVFKATQGGISGGGAPAFSAVLNSTITDNKIIWQNIGPVSSSPPPRGAAHGIVYAGSLWVANTSPTASSDGIDGPCALAMSDLNNPISWNPLNRAQIQKDDGGQITGLATFTIAEQGIAPVGSLLVFKDFATFQVLSVFGSINFAIQQLKTDMGAIAPRSILFIPGFGVMRLTHMGFAVTDGVRDKLLSEELRPYLFGDSSEPDITPLDWNFAYFSKAAQCANPPMYMCACPIIGGDPLQTLNGCSFILDNLFLPFFSGTYYCQVTVVGPMWESQISPELGPLTCVSGVLGNFKITAPGVGSPAGTYNYRAYIYQKNSSGQKTNGYFFDLPRGTSSFPLIDLSQYKTGYPPSGKTGALTRVFCYDLVLKAWAIIDLPFSISVLKQFRPPGSQPITMTAGYNDGSVRRIQGGDPDWDGTPINWNLRSRSVYGEGGTQQMFFRSVLVRGISGTPVIRIIPTINGQDQSSQSMQIQQQGGNQFEAKIDLIQIARAAHIALSGSGQVEIDSIDFQTEPGEVATPIVIA